MLLAKTKRIVCTDKYKIAFGVNKNTFGEEVSHHIGNKNYEVLSDLKRIANLRIGVV